jgi:outer membrane protein assembly factor BamB
MFGSMWLGDPDERGVPTPDLPVYADFSGSFAQAPVPHWERRLPGARIMATSHSERARAVADDARIYLGHAAASELLALSRSGGAIEMRYPASAPVQAEPLLTDAGVIFCDSAGTTWRYPRDADTPRWEHYGGAPINARPTEHEGLLFVSNVDDVVYALNAGDGTLRWRYDRPQDPTRESELSLFGSTSPVVAGPYVLTGFSDGALVALDRETGAQVWERRVGEGRYPDIIAAPVVDGGDVFVSGFSEPLVSMDLETRNVRWRLDVGGAAPPLVEGAVIFHGGSDGKLRAIDRLTGALLWTWDSTTTGALTTPQLVEAGLIAASSDGGIFLLDPETGDQRWTFEPLYLLDGFTATPLVVGRQLIATSNSGVLHSMVSPRPEVTMAFEGPGAGAPM